MKIKEEWILTLIWAVIGFIAMVSISGCRSNYPRIERPIKVWTAEPARAQLCDPDGVCENIPEGWTIRTPRCRLNDEGVRECEPIQAGNVVKTADDWEVVQKWIATLINECRDWRKKK